MRRLAPTRSAAVLAALVFGAARIAAASPTEAAVSELKSVEPKIRQAWKFDQPAVSEATFRGLAAQTPAARAAERALYETQVARALGLQQKFDDAQAVLDTVAATAAVLPAGSTALHVRARLAIERGRVWNSSGDYGRARPLFEEAVALADSAGLEALAVDAAHMVAIAAGNDSAQADALEWNHRAIARADASKDPEARRWRASLLNNLGWTEHGLGHYDVALDLFQRALAARIEMDDKEGTHFARWTVARCLRSLGRIDEALAAQRALLAQDEKEKSPDGYVYEELGECLLAQHKADEAKPWFARAYAELSTDPWLTRDEPARIERLRKLGGVAAPADSTGAAQKD